MKKLILLLIAMAYLYSCAPVDYTYYNNYSDEDLCVSYLTAASYNVHQPARKQQIEMRKLDCTKYVDLARLKMEKEAREDEMWDSNQTICHKVGNNIICNEY